MNTNEFLQKNPCTVAFHVRPEAKLSNGMTMSIQASDFHYCSPRIDYILWPQTPDYTHVEVGYPSESLPSRFDQYRDGDDSPVWAYVPVDLLDEFIQENGGFAD